MVLKENGIGGRLIPAGTGAAMNRVRVTASSKDAALRAAMRAATEAHLIAPESAAEEHAAELAQGPEAAMGDDPLGKVQGRSEEHTSELQSLMRISYAVFCLKKKKENAGPDATYMVIN